jgi:hypothetical protein
VIILAAIGSVASISVLVLLAFWMRSRISPWQRRYNEAASLFGQTKARILATHITQQDLDHVRVELYALAGSKTPEAATRLADITVVRVVRSRLHALSFNDLAAAMGTLAGQISFEEKFGRTPAGDYRCVAFLCMSAEMVRRYATEEMLRAMADTLQQNCLLLIWPQASA